MYSLTRVKTRPTMTGRYYWVGLVSFFFPFSLSLSLSLSLSPSLPFSRYFFLRSAKSSLMLFILNDRFNASKLSCVAKIIWKRVSESYLKLRNCRGQTLNQAIKLIKSRDNYAEHGLLSFQCVMKLKLRMIAILWPLLRERRKLTVQSDAFLDEEYLFDFCQVNYHRNWLRL